MVFEITFENAFNELFGFGAGDESTGIAIEFDSIKISSSKYVMKRFFV